MTFLVPPNPTTRIFFDFAGVPNGPLPSGWSTRWIQGAGSPEIYADHIRMGPTTPFNDSSRSLVGYVRKPVYSDNQIIRGKTRSALNGLVGGLLLKCDIYLNYGVLVMLTTDAERGIYTMSNGSLTKRADLESSHAIGDVWALKADGNTYSVIRNPNFNNTGGSAVASWTDNSSIVKHGSAYRYGALLVNSDRNAIGTQNWGPGWDDFDFRDLKWTA